MDNSYLNIITFLLTTFFYYLAIKPSLTYDISSDQVEYKKYIIYSIKDLNSIFNLYYYINAYIKKIIFHILVYIYI